MNAKERVHRSTPVAQLVTSKPSDTLGREFDPDKRDFSHCVCVFFPAQLVTSKPSDTLGREFDPDKRDFSH